MKGVLDRFEENYAIIELYDGKMLEIEKCKLPKEAKEGMVLNIEKEITINFKETKKRKKEIEDLTKDMWN